MRFPLLLLCLLPLLAWPAQAAQLLQPLIDRAPAGSTLILTPGEYFGPARISKPLVLEGRGQAVIDAGGRGTILHIQADDVTIRGLTLRNSGQSHDAIDGAIMAEGHRLRIEHNRIENVLFGISLHKSEDSLIRANHIRSFPVDAADRGDGLRLWYSRHNRIENNDIAQIRDITVSNATHNRFIGNTVRQSRRALNLLFAHRTLIEGNRFENNSTGIVALNSEGLLIRGNRILHAMDPSGAGVALKETSAALVDGNEIVHCAHGIMADSPTHPQSRIVFHNNTVAHNVTGIYFYGVKGGHIALNNRFKGNLWPVTIIGDGNPMDDVWWGNTWDDYQGFDRNHDGVGDTPHELYAYADRVWMDTPAARFFRNAPVLELLDFLERLAPFSAPALILRDPAPRMGTPAQ